MCFHSKQSQNAQKVEKRFKANIKDSAIFSPSEHYNAFSYPQTPIITNKEKELIQHFNWGLIPHWAKNNSIRQYTLNAKIETITQKPSFRKAAENRCLIISDGFFEWQWLDAKGKHKQKYLITPSHEELFAFGGIWSEWFNHETEEIVYSYSIVTTAANAFMSKIHNSKKRMPILLSPENEQDWLKGNDFKDFKTCKMPLTAKKV